MPLLYLQTSRNPRTMILAIFTSIFLIALLSLDEESQSYLRFMSATSQLRSLLDAIHDCRDKANALDWEAWNRNYF